MATATVNQPATRKRSEAPGLQWGIVVRYILLIGIGLLMFSPFILAFLGTFKNNAEITAFPPRLFPEVWVWQNWPEFLNTDVGGTARPEGATSLALMTGLFAAFVTLLATGLSSSLGGQSMSQSRGLAVAGGIGVLIGAAVWFYLSLRLGQQATFVRLLSTSTAVAIVMLIGVAILAMSAPDWGRVIMALGISVGVGALVTAVIELLAYALGGGTFPRWFFNTVVLAVLRACLQVVFCAMAAYAFARLRFPGKDLIFSFMLATLMIPAAVTLVPAYVLMARLEWISTAYSLVIPNLTSAFGIFLLTQFLKAIPRDLEEAAFVDGASYFQTFRDIIIPLARPALLTLFILQFQGMWNDFLTPLLYLNTPDMWVLNVALSIFRQQFQESWNLTLVGSMVLAIPVMVLFFIFSRYYIEGVSYAGVKG
jgi:multiple sugar transport system permease protein